MIFRRSPGKRLIRPLLLALMAAAMAPLAAPAAHAEAAAVRADDLGALIQRQAKGELRGFYAARGDRPMWLDANGRMAPAARTLLGQLRSAAFDGLDARKLKPRDLERALDRARSGRPRDLARAEVAASTSYTAYVQALRAAPRGAMIYESQALSPVVPTATAALQAAAAAGSLDRHVAAMGWMHPLYAPLRQALADVRYDTGQRRRIAVNLARLRALPANPAARYVLIDAAGARLWMYQDGRPVDTMRVVVGKAAEQTPMMAGFIRYAIVNPYWNVPDDLVRSRIAANVLAKGIGYLGKGGYQVVSGWQDDARPVSARTVDWQAVAAGQAQPRVRQLPGAANFMGKVKFMFPNDLGIYLHDTPDKNLMREDARQFSSGCVRLEDAARLGRWLMAKPLPRRLRSPEQRIELPEPVPVYITYLTAAPEGDAIAFRDDVYARDGGAERETRLARAER